MRRSSCAIRLSGGPWPRRRQPLAGRASGEGLIDAVLGWRSLAAGFGKVTPMSMILIGGAALALLAPSTLPPAVNSGAQIAEARCASCHAIGLKSDSPTVH